MSLTSVEFSGALEMFHKGLLLYYAPPLLFWEGRKGQVKRTLAPPWLRSRASGVPCCASQSQHSEPGNLPSVPVPPGPNTELKKGAGVGQSLWVMEGVSATSKQEGHQDQGPGGHSKGWWKKQWFSYAGLRKASCPLLIKYRTFYLFIWLAEFAFLAFLVGLYCCFFVYVTFFSFLKRPDHPGGGSPPASPHPHPPPGDKPARGQPPRTQLTLGSSKTLCKAESWLV